MKTKISKAIGYIRVSTDDQAQSGLGMESQSERIKAYSGMRGFDLVGVVEDPGVSGGVPFGDRPGGADVVRRVRRGDVDAVIVLKLDRAFRDTADALQTIDKWERKGVGLHVLDLGGNAVDTKTASGRFMLTVIAAVAEMERYQTKERTTVALEVKRNRGEKCGGSVPYGYRLAKDGKTLHPNGNEQKILARITRAHGRGDSLRTIATRLNKSGIRTKAGARWKAPQVSRALQNAARYASIL